MRVLLKNCRLIPYLSGGAELEYANVLLADGLIAEVLPLSREAEAERVLDCRGMTLLPGLFDCHAHLNWQYERGEKRLNDFKLLTGSCLSARMYLDYGFTTIRDMGTPKRVAAYVREAIRAGLFTGPRIISGGMIITAVKAYEAPNEYSFIRSVSGVDEMVRAVREEIGEGAEFVKLYAHAQCDLLPEEIEAAVRVAHFQGRRIAAHAHATRAINICIDAGVDTIEHGSYIDAAAIEKLKTGSSHLVPTMTVLVPEACSPAMDTSGMREVLKRLLAANAENITAAYRAGLVMGWGTDTPVDVFERVTGYEFKLRSEHCGMSCRDMLLQATKHSAMICGLEGVTGEVVPGLAADLILVDGKPDEDIGAMLKKPERVIVGGEIYR